MAAVWLHGVGQHYGDRLTVAWKYFSLEQVNQKAGPGVNVWDEPPGFRSTGLPAFKAAEASRRQGDDAFRRFHLALLAEVHEKGRRPATPDVIEDAARGAGLDVERLRRDTADPALLRALERDHTEGVRQGVFGTPTLVFEGGRAGFLKMRPVPPDGEMVQVFDDLRRLLTERPYIAEVKRPTSAGR